MVALWQHLIEKVNQQVFIYFRPKQLFETVVGKGVDILILKRHVD